MPDVQADIIALRSRFRELGFYERPAGRVLLAWLAQLGLGLGGLAGFAFLQPWPARVAAILVSTFGFLGTATVAHTASHSALSERSSWNKLIFYATYPFLLQLSATYWHKSHIQQHHPAPNILGLDADCDLRPFYALNEQHLRDIPLSRRWLVRVMAVLLPVVLFFNGFNMIRQGWQQLLAQLRDPAKRGPAAWADLACLLLHNAVWLAGPMLLLSWREGLVLYVLRVGLMGMGLFAILAPGHYPADAVCLERAERERGDFYLRQAVATVNFRTGPLGRFLCSGLEYQIEHHMFPSVSHVHLPRMQPFIRELCERHGMPYRTLGWGEAIWESYLVFFRPKPVFADVEALRLREEVRQAA